MSLEVSKISTVFVKSKVTAPHDPTSDQVNFAFTRSKHLTSTAEATWYPGSWQTIDGDYYACCLVGPDNSGVALTVGTYYIWVWVADSPEVPKGPSGVIKIF